MSYQSYLSTDYSRNLLSYIFRLAVILMNQRVASLLPIKGHVSIFESLHSVFSNVLLMGQLEMSIPEFDSFNEEIRLIARDKKKSVYFLLFCIFKLFYDYWIANWIGLNNKPLPLTLVEVKNSIKELNFFDVVALRAPPPEIRQEVLIRNFIYIFCAILCVWSARTYKFVIKNSAKQLVLSLIKWAIFFCKVAMTCFLIYISFFMYESIVSLIFLGVLIIHVLKLLRDASLKEITKLKLTSYAKTLKWVSLVLFTCTEIIDGILPFLKSIQIFQDLDLKPHLQYIEFLLFFVLVFGYLKDVKRGASLDFFFDVHLSTKLPITFQCGQKEDQNTEEKISTSYMRNYFMINIKNLLFLDDDHFNDTGKGFKSKFLKKFWEESICFREVLERMKKNRILRMNSKQKFRMKLTRYRRWFVNATIRIISFNFMSLLINCINLLSCLRFLFYQAGQPKQYINFLHYSLLLWNICSMVIQDPSVMKYTTIILIYPFYILDISQVYIWFCVKDYKKDYTGYSSAEKEKFRGELFSNIIYPHGSFTYFFLFGLITLYSFLLLYKLKMKNGRNKMSQLIRAKIHGIQLDSKLTKNFMRIFNFLLARYVSIIRYIPLMLAIIISLYSISLLNSLLFISSLLFLWKNSWDKKFWKYYLLYIFFLIIVRQIGNSLFPLEDYNLEIIAMIGVTSVEDKINHGDKNRHQMVMLFLLAWFASKRYRWLVNDPFPDLNKRKGDERKLEKKNKFVRRIKQTARLFREIFKYYMIWAFHLLFNITIIYDHKDVLSMTLFLVECIVLLIHCSTWKRGRTPKFNTIYRSWYVLYILVLIYATIRYLFFFIKYSTINYQLRSFPRLRRQIMMIIAEEFLLNSDKSLSRSYALKNFICPLLLLSISFLTKNSFSRVFRSHKNKLGKLSQPLKTESFEDEMIDPGQDFETTKKLPGSRSMNLKRRTTPFVTVYLLFKGLFIVMLAVTFLRRINFFKLIMTVIYLVNMINLFSKITKIIENMRLFEFLNLQLKYFWSRFVTGGAKNIYKLQNYDEDVQLQDYAQNKHYYEQFLIKLEGAVFRINRKYWGLCFIPLVVFSAMLSSCTFALRFILLKPSIFPYFIKFTGLIKVEPTDLELVDELRGIQLVIMGLIVEYVLTSFYLDCKVKLNPLNEKGLGKLLDSMQAKLELLTYKSLLNHGLKKNKVVQINQDEFEKLEKMEESFLFKLNELKEAVNERDAKIDLADEISSGDSKDSGEARITAINLSKKDKQQNYDELMKMADRALSENSSESSSESETIRIPMNGPKPKPSFSNRDSSSESNLDLDFDSSEESFVIEKKKKLLEKVEYIIRSEIKPNTELMSKIKRPSFLKSLISEKAVITPRSVESPSESLTNLPQKKKKVYKVELFECYMCELTSKEDILIYMNYNKYKFYLLRFIKGFLYIITRLGYLPLLVCPLYRINIIVMVFLVYFVYFSLKPKRLFVHGLKSLSIVVSVMLIFHAFNLFIFFVNKQEQKLYPQSEEILWTPMLQPISPELYLIHYGWFFIVSLGFCILPIMAWYVNIKLFCIKFSRKNIFHSYLYDKTRKRNLILNFKKWKNAPLKFTNVITKYGYINILETHSIITVPAIIYCARQNTMIALLFTLCVSIFQHFRKTSKRAFENTDSRNTKIETRQKFLKTILRIYCGIYWLIIILNNLGADPAAQVYVSPVGRDVTVIMLLIFSSCNLDFVSMDEFKAVTKNLTREAEVKLKFAAMCKGYEFNEDKIYKRLVSMMAKRSIDEMSQSLLDYKRNKSITLNLQYHNQCIKGMMREKLNQFIESHLKVVTTLKLRVCNWIYKFLDDNCNHFRYKDLLFLFNMVKTRNSEILKDEELNLQEYLDHEFEFFDKSISTVERTYNLLREKSDRLVDQYNERLRVWNEEDSEDDSEVGQFDQIQEDGFVTVNKAHKKKEIKRKSRYEQSLAPGYRTVNKEPKDLILAADMIYANLTKGIGDKKESLENFKSEFKKKGVVYCKYDRIKVVLYNISNDSMISTKGFNKFSLKLLLLLFFRFLTSKFELWVSLVIIILQVTQGGFLNIILIGVIIFGISVEERSGRTNFWKGLYILFLILYVIKFFLVLESEDGKSREETYEFFLGKLGHYSEIGQVLCILFLIENLKKNLISDETIKNLENPGSCVARLILNKDFQNMIERLCETEVRRTEQTGDYLSEIMKKKIKDPDSYSSFKLKFTKQLISCYSLVERFKLRAFFTAKRLSRLMRNDIYSIRPELMENFFYRNFSSQVKKN